MCYLIAKKLDERGCVAVETKRGKELAALVTYLGRETMGKGIQILTVTNKDVYGEYKPYHMVDTEKDFIKKVLEMV